MNEIIEYVQRWWQGPPPLMTVYTFCKEEEPLKLQQKVVDFQPPKDYLSSNLGDYCVYYPAGEWSHDNATQVLGKTFFGCVHLVKRDARYGFVQFEYTGQIFL